MEGEAPQYRHDAFISYSRKDAAFAKALEAGLEAYRTPRALPIPQHFLDVFRDESDFAGTAYYESIERHLQQSAALIVICSPDAAQSRYVEDEIRRFRRAGSADGRKIIPILYRGKPNNTTEPGEEHENAFPMALFEFEEMPLGIDYRGFDLSRHKLNKGAYGNPWYALLANICGVSRAEIEERDRLRQQRLRRLQISVVGGIFVVLLSALVVTLIQRQQAVRERDIAQSGQWAANAVNSMSSDPQLSELLGLEAAMLDYKARGSESMEAREVLHRALLMQRERLRIQVPGPRVNALTFSPDGRLLATADIGGLQMWDTVTGGPLPQNFRGAGVVLGVAFSPDGSRVATAGRDGVARLWEVTSGRQLRVFRGHSAYVWGVAFSPDGARLATASHDGTAKLWDVASGREVRTFVGHTAEVSAIAFSHDGTLLATGGADNTARIWDAETGRTLHTLSDGSGEGSIVGVAFSPDDRWLATVNTSRADVGIWNVLSGNRARSLQGHTASVLAVAYSADGTRLVSSSLDKTARLWDPATGKEIFSFTGHTQPVIRVAFSHDGAHVATGAEDGTARIWEVAQPSELPALEGHRAGVNHVVFSPDGRRIASASDDDTVRTWDAMTGRHLLTLTHQGTVNGVAFSPDGKRLATASSDKLASVFDAITGKRLLELKGHQDGVLSVVYSRDGRRLATGSSDRTARLWDAASGKELVVMRSDTGAVEAVDLNGDGTRAAIATYDARGDSGASAQIWNTRSDHALMNLDGDHVWVNEALFDREGKRLVTTGSTAPFLTKIWDTSSGQQLMEFSGHTAGVLAAAFSPGGRGLATGGSDSTIRYWNLTNGREGFILLAPNIEIRSIAFSPDSRRLASGDSDGTVRMYAMDPVELMMLILSRVDRAMTADECLRYLPREDCPASATSKLVSAKELIRFGEVDEGSRALLKVLTENNVPNAKAAVGSLLVFLRMAAARERAEVGDFDGAATAIRAAFEGQRPPPADPDAEVASWLSAEETRYAKQLGAARGWNEAIPILRRAVTLDSANESAFLQLAAAFEQQKKFGDAAAATRHAVNISPAAANLIRLADDERLEKNYPEAIATLNQAVALNPHSELAHRILGLIFTAMGDSTRALGEFQAAIAISPTKEAYWQIANIEESRKAFAAALDALARAKSLDPSDISVYEDISRINHEDMFNFEASYRELVDARVLAPDDASVEANLAEACLTAGQYQEAIQAAEELLNLPEKSAGLSTSDRVAIAFMRTAALDLSGQADEAGKSREDLVRFLNGAPSFEETWEYAGTSRFLRDAPMDGQHRAMLLQLLGMIQSRNSQGGHGATR